jgi:hypothetical protein
MAPLNLHRRAGDRRAAQPAPRRPSQWPVDPELTRRVSEARARLERTRRDLRRHVLPGRQSHQSE